MSQIDDSPTCPRLTASVLAQAGSGRRACPRCNGDRLRREARRIFLTLKARRCTGKRYATGGWYVCLNCVFCFDGITDHDDGTLPWWVEKRVAGRAAQGELSEEEIE